MDISHENFRVYIFIEFRRGFSASMVYEHLQGANLTNTPSRTTVFEWYKRFSGGHQSVCDDPRSGACQALLMRPLPLHLDLLWVKTLALVYDYLLDYSMRAKTTSKIVSSALVFAKSAPVGCHINSLLRIKPIESRQQGKWSRFLRGIRFEECCRYWCTEDETWALFDTPKTKSQNKAWLHPSQSSLTVLKPQLTNR